MRKLEIRSNALIDALANNETERELLIEALESLERSPSLSSPFLRGGALDRDEREAIESVRLYLLHLGLSADEKGERHEASVRLIESLDRLLEEIHQAADPAEKELLKLRAETLRLLHPSHPSHPSPSSAPRAHDNFIDSLSSIHRRWQAASPGERFGAWLKRKAIQHLLFYRLFFFAFAYWLRRRRIHRLLPESIRRLPIALETFSAVEEMSPIVDNFLFRGRGKPARDLSVAISDLGFLYMQMADELVDSILQAIGAEAMRGLIARFDERDEFIPLEGIDEDDLRSVGLSFGTKNEKYEASLGEMILALRELRELIDERARLERDEAETRRALRAFFHHCFSTFIDELSMIDGARISADCGLDELPPTRTLFHFYRKNNLVMIRWLELRAGLRGIDPRALADELRAFGYLLSSFQIFDDLKDLSVDRHHQPNYAIGVAAAYFPEELEALDAHLAGARRPITRDEIPRLNLLMQKTVLSLLRLARVAGRISFSWLESYVTDLRWRRNWLSRAKNFNPESGAPLSLEAELHLEDGAPIAAIIPPLMERLEGLRAIANEDERLAYAFDLIAFDRRASLARAALPNLLLAYRIFHLSLFMPDREKAALLRRILTRAGEPSHKILRLKDKPSEVPPEIPPEVPPGR